MLRGKRGLQGRQAEHVQALAAMRATAEAAEAACDAAERRCTVPSSPLHTLPIGHGTSYAEPPPSHPCVLIGLLAQVTWGRAAPFPTPATASNAAQCASAAALAECTVEATTFTPRGTLVRGPCCISHPEEHAVGGKHPRNAAAVPPGPLGSSVDVEHAQVACLLKHQALAGCLPAFRDAFAAVRRLAHGAAGAPPGALLHAPPLGTMHGPPGQPPPPPWAACLPWHQPMPHGSCAPAAAGADPPGPMPPAAADPVHARPAAPSTTAILPGGDDPELWQAVAPPQTMHEAVGRFGPPPPQTWHGPSLRFLGTGSSEPSKYRGPSAILLQVRMLLLCRGLVNPRSPSVPTPAASVGMRVARRTAPDCQCLQRDSDPTSRALCRLRASVHAVGRPQ